MNRLSARELAEWVVYYRLEPFGAERDAAHAGMVAATVANFSGCRSEGTIFKPSDFMVDYAGEKEPALTEEQEAQLQEMREMQLHNALVALASPAVKPALD